MKLRSVLYILFSIIMGLALSCAKPDSSSESFAPAVEAEISSDVAEQTSQEAQALAEAEQRAQAVVLTIEPEAGTYREEFDVSISSNTDGEIFYTRDGSDPSMSGTAKKFYKYIELTAAPNQKTPYIIKYYLRNDATDVQSAIHEAIYMIDRLDEVEAPAKEVEVDGVDQEEEVEGVEQEQAKDIEVVDEVEAEAVIEQVREIDEGIAFEEDVALKVKEGVFFADQNCALDGSGKKCVKKNFCPTVQQCVYEARKYLHSKRKPTVIEVVGGKWNYKGCYGHDAKTRKFVLHPNKSIHLTDIRGAVEAPFVIRSYGKKRASFQGCKNITMRITNSHYVSVEGFDFEAGMPGAGIILATSRHIKIHKNRFFGSGGVGFMQHHKSLYIDIVNNIFANRMIGVSLGSWAGGSISIAHNLFYNIKNAVGASGSTAFAFNNNIVHFTGAFVAYMFKDGGPDSKFYSGGNLFVLEDGARLARINKTNTDYFANELDKFKSDFKKDKNSFRGRPLEFVNKDFRRKDANFLKLKEDPSFIDRGMALKQVQADFNGNERVAPFDIGPFELGAEPVALEALSTAALSGVAATPAVPQPVAVGDIVSEAEGLATPFRIEKVRSSEEPEEEVFIPIPLEIEPLQSAEHVIEEVVIDGAEAAAAEAKRIADEAQ